ncbi:MAG: PAS domain S-box protein [Elusimicrobia bacterium]|nr:PAS domain S-box protein [Elusimicrobiota bacterium]
MERILPAKLATLMECTRTLLDCAADMIWIGDAQSGVFYEVNKAVARCLGYRREDMLGKPAFDFYFSESDRDAGRAFSKAVVRKGSAYLNTTLRARSGQPLPVELRGSFLEYEGKKSLLVIARDMMGETQSRRKAFSLYEAFRHSNDAVFYTDRNGIILDVNAAFTRTYGYAAEEAVGRTPRILRSRHSTDDMYRRMWESILDPAKNYWRGELINRTKDGREIPVILTITAVRDDSGTVLGYVSNAIDISEQVTLRSRVAQSEALANLGEMAAVVAHEIRNPLGSIVMAAKQLASDSLASEDREAVRKVLKDEGTRLNEVLTNFLSYARPRELKLSRSSLNDIVSEVTQMVHSNPDLLGKIRVQLKLARKLESFPMDADQIRQVVWNVVLNAVQAMEGRGVLAIETEYAGGRACVRILDSGPGIPDGHLRDIFKPFHTTKRQGTGLGLAIADRIIKAHGGMVDVKTRAGEGAAFTISLPAVQD